MEPHTTNEATAKLELLNLIESVDRQQATFCGQTTSAGGQKFGCGQFGYLQMFWYEPLDTKGNPSGLSIKFGMCPRCKRQLEPSSDPKIIDIHRRRLIKKDADYYGGAMI